MISIRDETTDDKDQILRVTVDAFDNSEIGHNGEAELIDSLRAQCANQLSIVACSEIEIVGHILFTPVVVQTSQNKSDGMGLAPLSVKPQYQHAGVGSSLVTIGLRRLFDDGCPFVVVLGHPRYYPRFGFRRASQFGISHGFSGIPQDVFFIQLGPTGTMSALIGGMAHYRREFGRQYDGK